MALTLCRLRDTNARQDLSHPTDPLVCLSCSYPLIWIHHGLTRFPQNRQGPEPSCLHTMRPHCTQLFTSSCLDAWHSQWWRPAGQWMSEWRGSEWMKSESCGMRKVNIITRCWCIQCINLNLIGVHDCDTLHAIVCQLVLECLALEAAEEREWVKLLSEAD